MGIATKLLLTFALLSVPVALILSFVTGSPGPIATVFLVFAVVLLSLLFIAAIVAIWEG